MAAQEVISAASQPNMDYGVAAMTFDEAWPILQEEAINKLINYLQSDAPRNGQLFTAEEFMHIYTVVYQVAALSRSSSELDKLYKQYEKTFEDYSSFEVLPSLRGKEGNDLLKEMLRGWNNHKTMLYWLSKFFNYISRYYIPKESLPSLKETSHRIFYNKVYREIKDRLRDAVVSLIEEEGEGKKTHGPLVRQVRGIFKEIGGDAFNNYEKDIKDAVIEASGKF